MRRISTARSSLWYNVADVHSIPFWNTLRRRYKQKLGSATFIWDDKNKDWGYRLTFIDDVDYVMLNVCSADHTSYLFNCNIHIRFTSWLEAKRFLKTIIPLIERSLNECKTPCKETVNN